MYKLAVQARLDAGDALMQLLPQITPSVEPTMLTAPAGTSPNNPPDTTSLEELTWEEIRDLMKAGKTTVIVPTGGTEKNGYHMVLGKHNYVVAHNADLMARRLKNALVAPTVKWVPEGSVDSQCPGCRFPHRRTTCLSVPFAEEQSDGGAAGRGR